MAPFPEPGKGCRRATARGLHALVKSQADANWFAKLFLSDRGSQQLLAAIQLQHGQLEPILLSALSAGG